MKKYHSRKYKVDENFFSNWSPVMAYVLGFWFADGFMRKEKSYRITFSGNDKEILFKIIKALKSNYPVRKDRNCYLITIFSKKLYNDLSKLGGFRKKSRTIKFPLMPKQLLPDFIRGYFDGDGSVFYVTYTRTKDRKVTRELRTNFTSGSENFLKKLMANLCNELGLKNKVLGIYNDGGSIKLGYGTKDSKKLLRYMYYKDFPIGMERKAKYAKLIQKRG